MRDALGWERMERDGAAVEGGIGELVYPVAQNCQGAALIINRLMTGQMHVSIDKVFYMWVLVGIGVAEREQPVVTHLHYCIFFLLTATDAILL